MREHTPPALIVLTCTVLYHALKEWQRNGGTPPVKLDDDESDPSSRKKPEWEYYFNRDNDGGK